MKGTDCPKLRKLDVEFAYISSEKLPSLRELTCEYVEVGDIRDNHVLDAFRCWGDPSLYDDDVVYIEKMKKAIACLSKMAEKRM